jgi:hypothetical protein
MKKNLGVHPTTMDAIDRILSIGDQFLEDASISNNQAHPSDRDPSVEQLEKEWEVVRPLLVKAPSLVNQLARALQYISDNETFEEVRATLEELNACMVLPTASAS